MRAQLPQDPVASEQRTGVSAELDRLARRTESIREAVSAAAAVMTRKSQPWHFDSSNQAKAIPPCSRPKDQPRVNGQSASGLGPGTKKEAQTVIGAVIAALGQH